MPANLIKKDVITALAAGLENADGNPRLKQVVNRLLVDLMVAVDELDISMDEFWTGVAYLTQAGKQNEFGLIVPGVVLEHFLGARHLGQASRWRPCRCLARQYDGQLLAFRSDAGSL